MSTQESIKPQIINRNGLRILCIAEIRGRLSLLNKLAKQYNASIIIHTGNFGFFDDDSIHRIHESYLRHIAAFSPLLDEDTINKVSELSKASGEYVEHSDENGENLKKILAHSSISELPKFISGELKLNIPVYTIHGMVEDLFVVNNFRNGTYSVPNLNIIDESNTYQITAPNDSKIFLCGIGGSLTLHKLFNQGTHFDMVEDQSNSSPLNQNGNHINHESNSNYTDDENNNINDNNNDNSSSTNNNNIDDEYSLPASGDPGNMWITMVQIGKLIKTVEANFNVKDVRIFVSHPSPSREGLLGHLSVFLKMDYTISNGLHFLYPTSCNELSICPSFEYYKSKFSDSRNQLAIIWKSVKDTIGQIMEENPKLTELITLALDAFDRIPVSRSSSINEEIIPLTLPSNSNREINSLIIRQQNDSYYISFQNMWHFNLCDVSAGLLLLNVMNGKFKMECFSEGFDFTFRKNSKEDDKKYIDSSSYDSQALNPTSNSASTSNSNSNSNSNIINTNGSSNSSENSPIDKSRYFTGGRGGRGAVNGYRGSRGRGSGRGSSRGRGFTRGRGA